MRAPLLPTSAALALGCGSGQEMSLSAGETEGETGETGEPEDPWERCYPYIKFGAPRLEFEVKHRLGLPDMPLSVAETLCRPPSSRRPRGGTRGERLRAGSAVHDVLAWSDVDVLE